MFRWCRILMLAAAGAVAVPGCAQNRAVGRAEMPVLAPSTPVETTVAAKERSVAGLARVPARGGKLNSGEISYGEEFCESGAVAGEVAEGEPALVVRADAKQTADGVAEKVQVVRGSEPNSVPGMGMPALLDQQLTLEFLSTWAQENHPLLRRDRARIVSADGAAVQAGLYPNTPVDTNNPQGFKCPYNLFKTGLV